MTSSIYFANKMSFKSPLSTTPTRKRSNFSGMKYEIYGLEALFFFDLVMLKEIYFSIGWKEEKKVKSNFVPRK